MWTRLTADLNSLKKKQQQPENVTLLQPGPAEAVAGEPTISISNTVLFRCLPSLSSTWVTASHRRLCLSLLHPGCLRLSAPHVSTAWSASASPRHNVYTNRERRRRAGCGGERCFISASSQCVTNPGVCLRGFKGRIRKSPRSKQRMGPWSWGHENIFAFTFLKGLLLNAESNCKC